MKDFNTIINDMKDEAKAAYRRSLKRIEDDYKLYYIAHLITKKWNDMYYDPLKWQPEAAWDVYGTVTQISIFLNEDQTVEKEVNIHLNEVTSLIEGNCLPEMTKTIDSSYVLYHTRTNDFNSLSIRYYYGASNRCRRVKVGTETVTHKLDRYELRCD